MNAITQEYPFIFKAPTGAGKTTAVLMALQRAGRVNRVVDPVYYDLLSNALKILRSKSSIFEFDLIFNDNTNEQKKRKYEIKRNKYNELFNSLEKEYLAELLSTGIGKNDTLLFNHNKHILFSQSSRSTKERLDITERLINLASQIINENNFKLENEFSLLEKRLGYEFDYVTSLFPQLYSEDAENLCARELKMQIDFILALIKECTKYLFRIFKSDLRLRYRSIVHFLFKNMDDESYVSNNQHQITKYRLLPIFNYSYNAKQGNNFTIEKYWKRRLQCCIN